MEKKHEYRLWDGFNREWVSRFDSYITQNGSILVGDINNPPLVVANNLYEVVLPTGLKDIEQFEEPKDLYIGDIVRMHQFLFDGNEYENEVTGVLTYDEDLACVCLTKMKQKEIQKYMGYENDKEGFEEEKTAIVFFYGLHESSWTYLGNIYENPDLLEAINGKEKS